MSDSAGEKTEQPTPKKLKDSRKKGQVAQSQDVNKLFVTLVGIELFIMLHANLLEDVKYLFEVSFQLQMQKDFNEAFKTLLIECLYVFINFTAILLLAVVIARLAAGFSQFGFLIAPEALKIDIKKLSPVSGAKNLFSKKKLVEFFSNIIKAIVLTIIFLQVVRTALPYILLLANTDLKTSIDYSIYLFSLIARFSLGFFLVISIIDFKLQKSIFIKQMKMTKDEVFREYKQTEGDPQIKSERKAFGQELAFSEGGSLKQDVESSEALVVNPTHFAIAIEYKPGQTPLPIIRAKGLDDRAKQMIKYAQQAEIPVIRHITLARYLFRTGQENKFIPRPSLQAMALVLRTIKEAKEQDKSLEDYHDLTDH